MKKYNAIYADPPWHYNDKASSGKRGATYKYPILRDSEIGKLNVESIAADDCVLFLWTTNPKIETALWVMRQWGFHYKTFAFTWAKMSKNGRPKWGMGNWTRSNSEQVLLGIRGKPKRVSASVHSLILDEYSMAVVKSIPGKHSEKPEEVRDRINVLMGEVPKIELFARKESPGWDTLGFDVGTGDIRELLP